MLSTLKQTAFARTSYFSRLITLTEEKCRSQVLSETYHDSARTIYFVRHCDTYGSVLHVGRAAPCALFACQCASEYRLELTLGNIMLMEFKRGDSVQFPDDVIPVCAGRTLDGRKAYLGWKYAGVYSEDCLIFEGMRLEGARMQKKRLVPDKMQVIVLRYSPGICTGTHNLSERESEGIEDSWYGGILQDKTGPFGWRLYASLHLS